MSGNRVQAIYAFPADRPDRHEHVVPSIRHWAAETDAVFQSSAAKSGGTRRVRFVTDQDCQLVVDRVPLSARGDDTFDNTIAELAARGYTRPDRKYLVWMDSTILCGIATYYVDDRPGQDNFNNGRTGVPGSVARIDAGCWGLGSRGQSVEAHELMHNLGAVLPTAPNSTPAGHCHDDSDRMCYEDGSPLASLRLVCGRDHEGLFDCGGDDYFSAAPSPGSFTATRWNTASSSFLADTAGTPLVSVADAKAMEGDSGSAPLVIPVTLSAPSSAPVSVRFTTGNETAQAGDDYVPVSGTLRFEPGEIAKAITVAVQGDERNELDEVFTVLLSTPANAVLARARAIQTIVDDEPSGEGYWFVGRDGGIFAFGDAAFHGSTGNIRLNRPIVGMTATPTAKGYWLVASDGGIFTFGDAAFHGSTGNIRLNRPIVGMTATPTAKGYWLVASDGGIFTFGDATFHGAPTAVSSPVVGMAATPTGAGYWVAGEDGVVHAFGDAPPFAPAGPRHQPVAGMAASPAGAGYWLVTRGGGVSAFGDARFFGPTGDLALTAPVVGMAAARPSTS